MESAWLTKDEIADALGVSSRTVQRRISALEASDPELVRREAGGAVLVAERAFIDGLVGTPTAPTTEQLFDDVSVARATADAYEADNERLRSELRIREAEAAILVIQRELESTKEHLTEMTDQRNRLREALTALANTHS